MKSLLTNLDTVTHVTCTLNYCNIIYVELPLETVWNLQAETKLNSKSINWFLL